MFKTKQQQNPEETKTTKRKKLSGNYLPSNVIICGSVNE